MIVTEEEAKTKRCQEGFGPSSDIRENPDEGLWIQPAYCLGSACMAWRWQFEGGSKSGYCGKAGKP